MSKNRKPIIVERLHGQGGVRVRRGIQWAVLVHADEVLSLANKLVDIIEQEAQHE